MKIHGNIGNQNAKKDKKVVYSALVQIRCTATQKEKANLNAEKNGMSLSEYLRYLIEKDSQ